MARVKVGFECVDCHELLQVPANSDIVDFIVAELVFYKKHNACSPDVSVEKKSAKISTPKKRVRKKK